MSCIRVSGGLGNQLFQLSLAVAISKATNKSVGLDTTSFRISKDHTIRNLEIDHLKDESFFFCDSTPFLTKFAKVLLASRNYNRYLRITNTVNPRHAILGLPIQKEQNINFDTSIDIKRESYFDGSFVTPEYWGTHRDEVLRVVRRIFNQNSGLGRPFNDTELAIHIRRGDYLSNKKARAFHGICSMDYYLEATEEMLRQFPQITKIQIFSDEYRFAEELKHLLLPLNLEINLNSNTGAVSVLAEMSNSKYFIGCNSTFSWWATALNENRISILPSQWFLDPSRAITNNRFFLPGVRVLNTTLF
jgi:hypothetical protein